jgi:hypothetical protein
MTQNSLYFDELINKIRPDSISYLWEEVYTYNPYKNKSSLNSFYSFLIRMDGYRLACESVIGAREY